MLNFDEGVAFWFDEIGVNTIPVDSSNKIPTIATWKDYQDSPISEEKLNEWIIRKKFTEGIAVIAGKIWRGPYTGKYLVCIDCDNKKGIEEFLTKCFPHFRSVDELALVTIVERHNDNKEKVHIYFITEKPVKNRGGICGFRDPNQNTEEIPSIEVKSEGKSYVVCSPSVHKNGFKYEIIGTKKPKVMNLDETDHFESQISQIYDKYSKKGGNICSNGQIPTDELFKDGFIVSIGNRHLQLLRAMESLLIRYSKYLTLEKIKELSRTWNNIHCSPPLDDNEFEKQWKCALDFVDKNIKAFNFTSYNTTFLLKKISDSPEIFYYADAETKRIGKYLIVKEYDVDTGKYKVNKYRSAIFIDAIPKQVFVYKNNPLVKESSERVKILFESNLYPDFEVGPYDNVDAVVNELENKHLIIEKPKANESLSCIINAHKEFGLVKYIDGITTPGIYLLKDKIEAIDHPLMIRSFSELDKEKLKHCAQYLNSLAKEGWTDGNIFPTVLKWGMMSPFCFSIKFNSDEFMPWLQLYGCGQSGKTTLGKIVLRIWNQDKHEKSIGFNNIDSVARFGYAISKDSYPILVNEVGTLFTNGFGKHTPIIELMKHSIESITCRGKYYEGKNYREILALSPMILTSNYAPPNDGSYNRRFVSIHFSEDEKKETNEQEKFKKEFDSNKHSLSILGDYALCYILKDPSMLVSKKWYESAKEILTSFYDFAGMPIPGWIDRFVEQRCY